MTIATPLRLIQAGLGRWGRSWATLAQQADGVALVAVVDPDPAAACWAADALDVACHPSLEVPLARTACDAVLLTTPPDTHRAMAIAALAAGKHVLIEKPLATTLADARAVVAAAEDAGRVAMVSQNYRWRAPARAVQRALAEGVVGDLIAIRIAFRHDGRLWDADNFRYHMRHPLLLDMTIHHFDLLRAITGQDVSSVMARSWRVPDSPFAHRPEAAALLTLAGGATVVYDGSWATRRAETSWNGEWQVLGERGRLRWSGPDADPLTGEVTLEPWAEPPRMLAPPPLALSDRAGVLEAFRTAIATGQPPETSAADNIRSLAAVLGAVTSIEEARTVDLRGF